MSIFGGARLAQDDTYAKQAHIMAQKLVHSDISVMTGGGPGVMEAASCGALAFGKKNVSIGIGVVELNEGRNPCVQEYYEVADFATRKWLLTHYAIGFVYFPGGFGTLDELAEVLTLVKTKKLPQVPIILIGTQYWKPFMAWLNREALAHKLLTEEHIQLFSIVDNIDEAVCILKHRCSMPQNNR